MTRALSTGPLNILLIIVAVSIKSLSQMLE